MDLEELNRQMMAFQNDFKTNQSVQQQPQTQAPASPAQAATQIQLQQQSLANYQESINAINFVSPAESPFNTTQIKRPSKSGEHRNDINDKLNSLKMTLPTPVGEMASVPNMMPQYSRSNSNYMELEPSPSQNTNHLANYYNNNFNTLQSAAQPAMQPAMQPANQFAVHGISQLQSSDNIIMNQNNFSNQTGMYSDISNTHSGGMSFANMRNMYAGYTEPNPNKLNNSGYHKIDEKRGDYRQNMNNKLDNFIFDNPNAIPMNPILQQHLVQGQMQGQGQGQGQHRDSRMVIQESSKDFYRQEANSRMAQYSPLSRASNVPINIANMSVNDFYANMYGNPSMQSTVQSQMMQTQMQTPDSNNKAVLNSRMSQYAPLAKTIQYQTPNQTSNQTSNQHIQHNKPNTWNPMEVNMKTKNVVYNELPVMSNK